MAYLTASAEGLASRYSRMEQSLTVNHFTAVAMIGLLNMHLEVQETLPITARIAENPMFPSGVWPEN